MRQSSLWRGLCRGSLAEEAKVLKDKDLDLARSHWRSAGEKYALVLEIKEDSHEAAYNWGIALADEAKAVKDQDLPLARAFWKAAGEKYAIVLEIKKDKHKAANNWGNVLLHEVQAIQSSQPEEAQMLLKQAQALLEYQRGMTQEIANQVAYNLAWLYAFQCKVPDCLQQLEICRVNGELSSDLRESLSATPIGNSPEFLTWWQKHFPDPA